MSENTDHAHVMIPPPLVFLGYLIGALIINWLVPFAIPWTLILRIIGGLALAAGIFLIGSAFSQMMNANTTPDANQPTTVLVTTGLYRFSRNPIYLGFFLIYIGFTLLVGTFWGILLSPFLLWTVTHAVINMEEEYLKRKFKDEYNSYSSHTRRWI
jgi:protein-S-isoprenylcysteine O-methyltransferase Ste14